ncbi:MAG: sulfotransferase domain-containing protein [Myxococcota bacterium]
MTTTSELDPNSLLVRSYRAIPRHRRMAPRLSITGTPLVVGPEAGAKKVAVFSHERSGTHFLMNTLAQNFGYISNPWWNLDYEQGINFHAPGYLLHYFLQVDDQPILNVLKSHHAAPFLFDIIDYLADQFRLFYIVRDPRDTMVSYWKFVLRNPYDEGPETSTAGEFARAAPRGAMLRYQKEQAHTVVHRWQLHVEGWLAVAENLGPERLMVVRYEDLNREFERTLATVAAYLDRPLGEPVRPARDRSVVGVGAGLSGVYGDHLDDEDLAFFRDAVGETMVRLGFEP